MNDKPRDETIKDQIVSLLRKGYRRAQLIQDFGFAERTVDAAISAYKELNKGNAEDAKGSGKPIADDEAPASQSKNRGKGATEPSRDGALAIRKEKESVLPEWLERDVAEIFDGQTRDQRIFLAGMSVPLMGLRLFAEGVKPIIDLLSIWQEGQAQAARAVQSSGTEIARATAQEVVSDITPQFMQALREASTASSPNPFASMLTRLFEPHLQQMISSLMKGFGMPIAGMPGGQAQVPPDQRQTGQPGFPQSGFEPATESEIKEAFGNA